jgi:hypothetical protein
MTFYATQPTGAGWIVPRSAPRPTRYRDDARLWCYLRDQAIGEWVVDHVQDPGRASPEAGEGRNGGL